ncbi:MAG TPA: decarboxylating 6-phosphogluconate dehydrogenase [Chloroflexota bacterium]|nr:decarboxylating 6-phosphogluconate dehydrogenase [Chloroflexota bacterium]
MELGMVGLGRMGGNMVSRLLRKGHRVIVYNRSPGPVREKQAEGAVPSSSLEEFVARFADRPRVMWVMLPAGEVTTDAIRRLAGAAEAGDIIIDGANSNWKTALADAATVKERGLRYMDAGTSGGIWGIENGYCLMVGGADDAFEHCRPIFEALKPDDGGLVHTGPEGSGHFVKMVHNGIEYGLMQAYAEGFEIMQRSKTFPDLDLHGIADAWRNGSVVRSWLLDLIVDGLSKDPRLSRIRGYVEDTGEGRWTVDAAIEEDVPATVIAASLFARFRSRQEDTFADKMLAMMRNEFGGHAVVAEDPGTSPAGAP